MNAGTSVGAHIILANERTDHVNRQRDDVGIIGHGNTDLVKQTAALKTKLNFASRLFDGACSTMIQQLPKSRRGGLAVDFPRPIARMSVVPFRLFNARLRSSACQSRPITRTSSVWIIKTGALEPPGFGSVSSSTTARFDRPTAPRRQATWPRPDMSLVVVGGLHRNADGSNRLFEMTMCLPGEPVVLVRETHNPVDATAVASSVCAAFRSAISRPNDMAGSAPELRKARTSGPPSTTQAAAWPSSE